MRVGGLAGPERRLWMGFPYGEHIDLRGAPDRVVRAEVIMDLLVGRRPVDERQENEHGTGQSPSVFLSGARITGQLDLRGIDFEPPLLLQECEFEKPLVIADSLSRSVRLYGCQLPGVQGAWLKCGGDLHLRDCQIDGELDLEGAYVGGQLLLSGPKSRLSNPGGVAVRANGLVVAGDMFCRDGAVVEGEINLVAARIGGELRVTRSTLRNPGKVAFNAERITVEKDMYCREGSRPKARCACPAATSKVSSTSTTPPCAILEGSPCTGLALVADGLRVDSDMTCDAGFTADGEIRLKGARIGKNLDFSGAVVNNSKEVTNEPEEKVVDALNAEDMQADRMLMPARCPSGRISLRYGKVVELDDKLGVETDRIDITGLSYETLIPPLDPKFRLEWLAKNDYEPQPYDQMARSYRQLGYDDRARKVQLEQERRRRKTLSAGGQMWGYLQDWTIGYGYHTNRAAALFGLVLLVGAVGFSFFPPEAMDAGKDPQFNPIFYTLDVLVPFADFGQRELWNSTVGREVFKVILAIFGWTLAITAIAGINRKLTRL